MSVILRFDNAIARMEAIRDRANQIESSDPRLAGLIADLADETAALANVLRTNQQQTDRAVNESNKDFRGC